MKVIVAAARRLLTLLAIISGGTAILSLLLGLAAGSKLNRAISLGFYIVGSFVLLAGFFIGNRGPARFKGEEHGGIFGPRHLRWATLEERTNTLNDSAVFVTVGFILLLIGLAVDARVKLI